MEAMTPAVNPSHYSSRTRIISIPPAHDCSLILPFHSRYNLRHTLGRAIRYRARNQPTRPTRNLYRAGSVLAGSEWFRYDTIRRRWLDIQRLGSGAGAALLIPASSKLLVGSRN